MSDPTAPVEGTQVSSTPEAAPASSPDAFAPVLSRVDELANSIDSRFAQFEQRLPAPPEPAPEKDPWEDLFGTPDPEPDPYAQQQQAALDPQALQNAIQAAIQQSNAPLVQRLQHFELQQANQQLGQRVPALADLPENHPDHATNKANRQQAFELVNQALANFPTEHANALAADPNFIAMAWKAAEADRLAQGQAPVGGAPSLETAGGALPGGQSEPVNPVTQAFANRPPGLPSGFGR